MAPLFYGIFSVNQQQIANLFCAPALNIDFVCGTQVVIESQTKLHRCLCFEKDDCNITNGS